ncbi:hypothetical protein DV711_05455 [Motiliproteus coralliicola]|uniref:Uncharacterized protein n=1 Tax=Motiliproteus coralliicola TaxID=2283196 RepID=A0A369WZR4_9GAMM|nr:hypothetical protein [Motiliproteus coralliicola]RDE25015.1 hypothetical protein DV711_05455 [Motiliproteus coralliicola]
MDPIFTGLPVALAAVVVFWLYRRERKKRRQQLIDEFRFPPSIAVKLTEKYPQLSEQDVEYVFCGLREYFHLCNLAGKRMVSMPSQVVDVAWHEFILFTRKYEYFCGKALGRFLHHTPAEAMRTPTDAQQGLKLAWKLSCQREGMAPKAANRLPLLFAIDQQLNIDDGFKYALDCKKTSGDYYCAGHIGCGGGCGGGGDSDSSGCGGGCGGD